MIAENNDNQSGYLDILNRFSEEGRCRTIPADRTTSGLIDLCSNDYLGLGTRSEEFITGFMEKSEMLFTSSASRLLSSRQNSFSRLENMLSDLYGKEVLLFNSGYHANVGALSALNIPGTIFLADKLIHASAIDGLMLGNATFFRWRHNDIDSLVKLLDKYHDSAQRVIVVAESIYSMDGDLAPIEQLVDLKKQYPRIIIYLDEAHGFGVRGDKGLGLAEEHGLLDDVDIIIGTLGKACASCGAFIATTKVIREFLLNSSRSFIFSTSFPPVCCDWTVEMIRLITGMQSQRKRLAELSEKFRIEIERLTGKTNPSKSQIVPLMVGDARKTVQLAARLKEAGIDVLPIRRPTVPPGTERIRFSLNAEITDSQMKIIIEQLQKAYNNED